MAASTKHKKQSQNQAPVDHIQQKGVSVNFKLATPTTAGTPTTPLRAGEEASIEFTLTDATTQKPIIGRKPRVWIAPNPEKKPTSDKQCRKIIGSYLQGSLGARPEIDLNAYYILALNQEANISVIDPLQGYGGSKLLALVELAAPGTDWVLDTPQKRLFVATPSNKQVAVVDTATWKVTASIEANSAADRLFLQPDGKKLWLTAEGAEQASLAVIDTDTLKVLATPETKMGGAMVGFSTDSRQAFVSQGSALSIFDTQTMAKRGDINLQTAATSLAYANLAQALYVVHGQEGYIEVVDGSKMAVIARLEAKPGMQSVHFSPDGRWAFAPNPKDNHVYVFDTADNSLAQTIDIEGGPDRVSFTGNFAYIHASKSEYVGLIPLSALNQKQKLSVLRFAAGQQPPEAADIGELNPLAPTPEGNAVIVANAAEKTIYYYAEGMNAPMGSFQNYLRHPKALLVVDRGVRETAPGVYASNVKLAHEGRYNVAFVLDTPRITHCFNATVTADPKQGKDTNQSATLIEPLSMEYKLTVGQPVRLRFKATDSTTKQPKIGLKDVGVMAMLAPGIWQQRLWAQSVEEGIYEVSFTPPKPGMYYTFVHCPSLGVALNRQPTLILQAHVATADSSSTMGK
nr:YncE family protein [Crenothrix polyspora]